MKRAIAPLTRIFPLVLIFASTGFLYAQSNSLYRLPAGTKIKLKLGAELRTGVSSVGDTFIAKVAEPVRRDGEIVLPEGTSFEGRITAAEKAKIGGRDGELKFAIEYMLVGVDVRRTVSTRVLTKFGADSTKLLRAASIVGGTAVGALIGFAAGDSSGALIGAGVGAGLSTGTALLQRGNDVRIKKDQTFVIELKEDLILPVLDY
ncbi:MAG TPA: hypothetical protein PLR83_11150 [Pyrinomonadaceae bacterium]|nr:hypothetical protein [Pyrinomonadaceae bacterium]